MSMDNMDLYSLASSPSLCHLMESEEDFPLGAKTTSFLPPATVTNVSSTTTTAASNASTFDLPEWMEARELLELPNMGLFENMLLPGPPTALDDSLMKMEDEEDFSSTIKPEDMLVPLSELQPPTAPSTPPLASTPPASPLHFSTSPVCIPGSPPLVPASPPQAPAPAPAPITQVQANAPLPKIIICRKVDTTTLKDKPIKVHYQVMPVKQVSQIIDGTPLLAPTVASGNSQRVQAVVKPVAASQGEPKTSGSHVDVPLGTVSAEVPQSCDAEELIDEMMQMIGNNNTTNIFQGLDMEELLLQLEASTKTLNTEADSQASLAVPLPSASPSSCASLSPHPSETTFSGSLSSPSHSETTFPASPISLPSPVPSVGSLSPAQSTSDSLFPPDETSSSEDLDEKWTPLEETHSYSKSTRKARPSRRTLSSRKTPYPEDRKERKKEQNKQAALRYRQKKKQEEDDLTSKIEAEEKRQEILKTNYADLKRELSCLKKIMREVFIAKGMLSEEALKQAALAKKNGTK